MSAAAADELEPNETDQDEQDGPVCPECGESFTSALSLGAHRFHKHGIKGSKPKPQPGRKRGRPRMAAAGDDAPESGRQARRRRAVKETLIELVSFTDEARGRADGEVDDLADVIRRDADKIANSVAWIAERFLPLGRAIDLLFGHGGALTVARGFLGVGTWSLGHWRALIQERQAQADLVAEGQTAEEMADEMARTYLS